MTCATQPRVRLSSPRPGRLLMAFLLAPLAGPLGIGIGMMPALINEIREPIQLLALIPLIYLFGTPFVYIFSLLLGAPLYLLLHTTLGLSKRKLIAGWAMVGALSIFCLSGFHAPERVVDLLHLFPFALGGAAVGYAFWWIVSTDPKQPTAHNGEEAGDAADLEPVRISNQNWR